MKTGSHSSIIIITSFIIIAIVLLLLFGAGPMVAREGGRLQVNREAHVRPRTLEPAQINLAPGEGTLGSASGPIEQILFKV